MDQFIMNAIGLAWKDVLNWEKFCSIDLPNNGLKGTIPTEIHMLSSLSELGIRHNQVRRIIPMGMKWFEKKCLTNNVLTGTIPSLLKAKSFDASYSMLTGTIQSPLINLKGFEEIRLWNNRLTGPFQKIVSPTSRLYCLEINHNYVSGTIPSEKVLATGLTQISSAHDQLDGTIPTSIGNLIYLWTLNLHTNKLSGVSFRVRLTDKVKIFMATGNNADGYCAWWWKISWGRL